MRLSLSKAERLSDKPEVELLALDDALNELAVTNPKHSRVVELRFFGGLTIEETAQVPLRTEAGRRLAAARREVMRGFARQLRAEHAEFIRAGLPVTTVQDCPGKPSRRRMPLDIAAIWGM